MREDELEESITRHVYINTIVKPITLYAHFKDYKKRWEKDRLSWIIVKWHRKLRERQKMKREGGGEAVTFVYHLEFHFTFYISADPCSW